MIFRARIEVNLKAGHADPEGEAIKGSLRDLNYEVVKVSTAKLYEISFHANSKEEAKVTVDEMCRRLLANPVKDDYNYEIAEAT
jgi:phosphoribosylformylglycinamidine synthase PurS subunit